jgi:hypothetical protein
MNEFWNFFILLIGYYLIFSAMDIHRNEESRIYLFDKYWWSQIIMVIVGVEIIIHFANL